MRFISCHDGKLQTLESAGLKASPDRSFVTGLDAWDALAPQKLFARGAVHELLFDVDAGPPTLAAATIAQAAAKSKDETTIPSSSSSPVVWSDPRGEIYPPALAALGFDLARTFLLRTSSDVDEAWAVAECLRCRGVGAVIAQPPASRRMTRIEARRLQLAAESGGSVGILLRQTGRGDDIYAAATRWHVAPIPGEPTVQRWTIRLIHGHGGRIGQSLVLEWRRERENHLVRAIEQLADRPAATPASRATA